MYITISKAIFQPLILLLSCLGVGLPVLRLILPDCRDLKILLFLGVAVGSGIIGVYSLGCSFLGLVYPLTFWFITGVGLLGFLYNARELYSSAQATINAIFKEANVIVNCLLVILLILYYDFFLASLAPVIAGDAYKYEISKLIVKYHKMVVRPEWLLADMPNLLGMLFVYSQSIFDFDSIKIVCFIIGFSFCLGSYVLARRYLSREGALITAILITLIPPFYQELYEPYIEVGWSLWGLAGIYLILHLLEKKSTKLGPYLLGGFLLGCAASGKQFAPIVVMAVCLLILLPFRQHKLNFSFYNRLKISTILALTSFFIVLPWYLKSYIYTGDPFYPYGANFLKTTSEFLSAQVASRVFTITATYDPLSSNPLRIPLFLVFWTFPILYKPFEPYWIHPFILAFLPLYFLTSRSASIRDRRLWFLALSISIPIVFLSPLIRFCYIPLTILTILALGVYENLSQKYNIKASFLLALTVYLIFSLGTVFHKTTHTLSYTFGLVNKKEYLLQQAPRWANNPNIGLELWLADHLPPEAKILISGLSGWMGFFTERERWDMHNLEAYLKWHHLEDNEANLIKVLKDHRLQFIVFYGTHMDKFYLAQKFLDMYQAGKIKKIYAAENRMGANEITYIFQAY
jgi:hypothetical protein